MRRIRFRLLSILSRAALPLRHIGLHRAVRVGRRAAGLLGTPTAQLGRLRLRGAVEHRTMLEAVDAGTFEPQTLARFQDAVHVGATVLDVGANIGVFSLLAAERVGASGRVLAVEPDPRSRRWLQENARSNGFSNVINVVAAALGATSGEQSLILNEADPSQSALGAPTADETAILVPVVPGHELVDGSVDVVKIDVEGREIDVLRGLELLLARSPGAVLFCELNPRTLRLVGKRAEDLVAELERQGFRAKAIDEVTGQLIPVPPSAEIAYFVNLQCSKNDYRP